MKLSLNFLREIFFCSSSNFISLSLFFADGLLVNGASRPGVRHSSEPRKRFPASGSSDEDPYSLTPSGSSGSSGKGNNNGNSRIPPGEKEFFGPQNWAKVNIYGDFRQVTFTKLNIVTVLN